MELFKQILNFWCFVIFLCITNIVDAQTVGIKQNDSLAYNGYTLFSPMGFTKTYLIDNCGNTINEWESDFVPNFMAYMIDGGRLLRVGRSTIENTTHFEIFNWEGEIDWSYDLFTPKQSQHHDIEYLANGNIIGIFNTSYSPEQAINFGRNPIMVEDEFLATSIIEIQPLPNNEAEIVWEWNMIDHTIQDFDETKANYGVVAEHPELFDINYFDLDVSNVDWVHNNSIEYNAELDQIMLSSRNFDEIWIIDHSTTTEEAASHEGGTSNKGGDILFRWGKPSNYLQSDIEPQTLEQNHDARWLTENDDDFGKIMIFNNGGSNLNTTFSTVEVINPPINENGTYLLNENGAFIANHESTFVVPEDAFIPATSRMSGAHILPNGNKLVTYSNDGNIREFDKNDSLVWHYTSPVNTQGTIDQGLQINGNLVFRAYKYSPFDSIFEGLTIETGAPIETNPVDYGCQIYEQIPEPEDTVETSIEIASINNSESENIKIYPSLFQNKLSFETINNIELKVVIYNAVGKEIYQTDFNKTLEINTSTWKKGIYFASFYSNSKKLKTTQIVKF